MVNRRGLAACAGSCAALVCLLGYLGRWRLQTALRDGIHQATVWSVNSPPHIDARFRSNVGPGAGPDISRFYVFNLTNVEDVRQGQKPRLVELGPYTYRKTRVKVSAWWNREGRVAVKEYIHYTHLPEESSGSVDDMITTLNLPLIGVVEAIHGSPQAGMQLLLDLLVSILAKTSDPSTDRLFMLRTVHELLWGYEDALLTILDATLPKGMVPRTRFELVHNMSSVDEALSREPSIIDTGAQDPSRTWQRQTQDGWSYATCWACGPEAVHGTDGQQFAPGTSKQDVLTVWIPDLVRAVPLVYLEDVQHQGIDLLRFTPADEFWATLDECHDQLQYRGLVNITSPTAVTPHGVRGSYAGPPIFASEPHFCGCDPVLTEQVEGIQCDEAIRHTYIDVEPTTGIPMRGLQRMMISSQLTDAGRQYLEPGVATSAVVPIFRLESGSSMTEEQADMFRKSVYRVQHVIHALSVWPQLLAAVALIAAGVVWIWPQASTTAPRRNLPSLPSGEAVQPLLVGAETPDHVASADDQPVLPHDQV